MKILIISIICFAFSQLDAAAVLVTHIDTEISEVKAKDLKKIYLGKKKKLDDIKINLAVLKEGDVHKTFIKKYTKKTTSQFKIYWRKIVFTGKGSAPEQCENEKEMLKYIEANTETFGYVDEASIKDKKNIKIITIN